MAQSRPYSNKDLTKCGICLSTQQEPKSLPCLHSYCLQCLAQWAKGKAKVSCPICTQEFEIPDGGVRAFRTSFFINTLKERQTAALTLQATDAVVPCASCAAVDEKVDGHCTKCGGFICVGCIAMHGKLKLFSNHKVVPYEDLKSGKVDIRNLSQKKYCHVHEDQVLWFYCETCEMLVCRDCTVVDHSASRHNLVNLETASKDHRREIGQLVENCEAVKKKMTTVLEDMANVSEQLTTNATKAKSEIDESFKEALRLLEDSRGELKRDLDTSAVDAKKQLEAQKDGIHVLETRLATAMQMASEVVQTGSDYDLAIIYSSLKANLTELRDVKLARVSRRIAAIRFEKAHIDRLGSVKFMAAKTRKDGVRRCTLETSFGSQGAGRLLNARGIAVTQDGGLTVADMGDSTIKMYSNDGQFKSSFKVPGQAWNVAVSTDGRVFVTAKTNAVSVYDEGGHLKQQFPVKSPNNMMPSHDAHSTLLFGLAIDNFNNRLFVGEQNQSYISKHRLDGSHISSFRTTIWPKFISVSSDEKILVSNDTVRAAHVYMEDGVHLQTLQLLHGAYWDPVGSTTVDMEFYVCAYNGSAIHCFSAETGTYLRCLTNNVSQPVAVALMEDESRLAVLQTRDIRVFKLE